MSTQNFASPESLGVHECNLLNKTSVHLTTMSVAQIRIHIVSNDDKL